VLALEQSNENTSLRSTNAKPDSRIRAKAKKTLHRKRSELQSLPKSGALR
jgi:hypothetical protein